VDAAGILEIEAIALRHDRSFAVFLIAGMAIPLAIILVLVAALVGDAGLSRPVAALANEGVVSAVLLSLGCATASSLLGLAVAVPAAYALARFSFPGRRVVDAVLDIPIVLSPIAVGMMLLFFFRTGSGAWIQNYFIRFVFEIPGIILAQFIVASALQVRVLKATFEKIPPRMELVARFLGCGPWSTFRRVTLPLARPGLLSAFILGWGRAMGEYGATVTVAGAVRGKTETVPVAIVLNWNAVRLDAAVGLVMVLVVSSFAVLLAVRFLGGSKQ